MPSVLVVDDEPDILDVMKKVLKKQGYQTFEALRLPNL
jgi:CheY-like chemotaxis protein